MAVEHPNCLQCVHYFITYDARRPYGCRAMGFKSRYNPAQVVLASSGLCCQLYKQKKGLSGRGGDGQS